MTDNGMWPVKEAVVRMLLLHVVGHEKKTQKHAARHPGAGRGALNASHKNEILKW